MAASSFLLDWSCQFGDLLLLLGRNALQQFFIIFLGERHASISATQDCRRKDTDAQKLSDRKALRSVAARCIVVTVVGLPVQCVTGPGRPRLGVQRPGPGPTVAHGYPGARRCASSAVRFAWCLATTPILSFDVFGVNIVSVGVKTLQTRAQRPPLCLL